MGNGRSGTLCQALLMKSSDNSNNLFNLFKLYLQTSNTWKVLVLRSAVPFNALVLNRTVPYTDVSASPARYEPQQ